MSDPGASGYVVLLRRCIAGRDLEGGRRLHAQIVRSGWHTDLFVANLLIQMYGACRSIASAMAVFRELRVRNLFTINITIAALAQNGCFRDARSLFVEFPRRDVITWNSMLTIAAQRLRIGEAREVFARMPARSVDSANAMIAAIAQCGQICEAQEFFRDAERDVSSWNNFLHPSVSSSEVDLARSVFDAMPHWARPIGAPAAGTMCAPDAITFSCMLCAWSHIGSLDHLVEHRRIMATLKRNEFMSVPWYL